MDASTFVAARNQGGTGWNIWRAAISVLYLAAAAFNLGYTLPNARDEGLFDGYADGAWFGFLGDLVDDVFVPAAALWMVLVVVFELVVAALIANRGRWVDRGVVLSLAWVLAILPFLAWPYLLVNIGLAALQAIVLLRRYERTLWQHVRPVPHGSGGPIIPAGQ